MSAFALLGIKFASESWFHGTSHCFMFAFFDPLIVLFVFGEVVIILLLKLLRLCYHATCTVIVRLNHTCAGFFSTKCAVNGASAFFHSDSLFAVLKQDLNDVMVIFKHICSKYSSSCKAISQDFVIRL